MPIPLIATVTATATGLGMAYAAAPGAANTEAPCRGVLRGRLEVGRAISLSSLLEAQ